MTHTYTQVIAGTCLGDLRKSVITAHIQEKDISIEYSSTFSIFKCALFFFLSIWNEQGLVSFGGRNLKGEVVGSISQITQAPSSLEQLPLTKLLTLAVGSTTVLRSCCQEGWETKKELDSGYFWASMWQGDQKNKNTHLNPSLALSVWSWISYLTSLGLLSSSAIWRM